MFDIFIFIEAMFALIATISTAIMVPYVKRQLRNSKTKSPAG